MIPELGPSCDLCVPEFHYLLKCQCGHEWDEPPTPGKFWCPVCKAETQVTQAEDEQWQTEKCGVDKP